MFAVQQTDSAFNTVNRKAQKWETRETRMGKLRSSPIGLHQRHPRNRWRKPSFWRSLICNAMPPAASSPQQYQAVKCKHNAATPLKLRFRRIQIGHEYGNAWTLCDRGWFDIASHLARRRDAEAKSYQSALAKLAGK